MQTTIATIAFVVGLAAPALAADPPAAPVSAPPKVTPELIAKGQAAFTLNCAPCHGEKGDGSGPYGENDEQA